MPLSILIEIKIYDAEVYCIGTLSDRKNSTQATIDFMLRVRACLILDDIFKIKEERDLPVLIPLKKEYLKRIEEDWQQLKSRMTPEQEVEFKDAFDNWQMRFANVSDEQRETTIKTLFQKSRVEAQKEKDRMRVQWVNGLEMSYNVDLMGENMQMQDVEEQEPSWDSLINLKGGGGRPDVPFPFNMRYHCS